MIKFWHEKSVGKFKFCGKFLFPIIEILLAFGATPALGLDLSSAQNLQEKTAVSSTTPENSENKKRVNFAKLPPFNADEFWKKILLLLRENNGYVTKNKFEDAFGVSFQHVRDLGENSYIYSLDEGIDWYMNVGLDSIQNGQMSRLDIRWHTGTFGDPYKGQCVNYSRASSDILSSGWSQGYKSRQIMTFDTFSKDENKLTLYFIGECVSSIRFQGSRT